MRLLDIVCAEFRSAGSNEPNMVCALLGARANYAIAAAAGFTRVIYGQRLFAVLMYFDYVRVYAICLNTFMFCKKKIQCYRDFRIYNEINII